ncbi:hypothetical protein J3A83DRAFT_4188146 [Scleroderma citrinum]
MPSTPWLMAVLLRHVTRFVDSKNNQRSDSFLTTSHQPHCTPVAQRLFKGFPGGCVARMSTWSNFDSSASTSTSMDLIWTVTGTGDGLDYIDESPSRDPSVSSISFTINVARRLALDVSHLAAVALDSLMHVLDSSKDDPLTRAFDSSKDKRSTRAPQVSDWRTYTMIFPMPEVSSPSITPALTPGPVSPGGDGDELKCSHGMVVPKPTRLNGTSAVGRNNTYLERQPLLNNGNLAVSTALTAPPAYTVIRYHPRASRRIQPSTSTHHVTTLTATSVASQGMRRRKPMQICDSFISTTADKWKAKLGTPPCLLLHALRQPSLNGFVRSVRRPEHVCTPCKDQTKFGTLSDSVLHPLSGMLVSNPAVLLSVSTTPAISPSVLRSDMRKVLGRMRVQCLEIKAGFECIHIPWICPESSQVPRSSQHRRRGPSGSNDMGMTRAYPVKKASKLSFSVKARDRERKCVKDREHDHALLEKDVPRRPSVGTALSATPSSGTPFVNASSNARTILAEGLIIRSLHIVLLPCEPVVRPHSPRAK